MLSFALKSNENRESDLSRNSVFLQKPELLVQVDEKNMNELATYSMIHRHTRDAMNHHGPQM